MLWFVFLYHAFAQTEVRCCEQPALSPVLDGYLSLQRALSSGRKVSSVTYVYAGQLARAAADSRWSANDQKVVSQIHRIVQSVRNKSDPQIRAIFPAVSRQLTVLIYAHASLEGSRALLEVGCGEQGPYWQEVGPIASPYPGADCTAR